MMRLIKPFHLTAILILLGYSCSKKNNPTPPPIDNYNITLVSGNNQTAAIGYGVKDSIVVKVTDNGNAASSVQVQFVGSGCNEDLVTNVNTKGDGSATYYWTLAADQGQQTLRAVIIAGGKRVDSTSASATAVTATSLALPLKSACIPPNVAPESIVGLTTGQLLSCFNEMTSIRYSNDNGLSWSPLTGFGASHKVVLLATSPKNEILAATSDEGVFYSKDAGSTWLNISPPAFDKQDVVSGLAFTNSGKIIFSGSSTDFFISADKGTTWSSVQSGLVGNTSYWCPVELNNGDLYLLSLTNYLFKSTDGGATWKQLPNNTGTFISGICVDNNGFFYVATSGSTSDSFIMVSKDNGVTFTNAYTQTTIDGYLDNLEVINGDLFFDEALGSGIYKLINSSSTSLVGYEDRVFVSYTLNSQGQLVYAGLGPLMYGGIEGIYY